MAQCRHCGRAFKSRQSVRAHLKGCAEYRGSEHSRPLDRPTGGKSRSRSAPVRDDAVMEVAREWAGELTSCGWAGVDDQFPKWSWTMGTSDEAFDDVISWVARHVPPGTFNDDVCQKVEWFLREWVLQRKGAQRGEPGYSGGSTVGRLAGAERFF